MIYFVIVAMISSTFATRELGSLRGNIIWISDPGEPGCNKGPFFSISCCMALHFVNAQSRLKKAAAGKIARTTTALSIAQGFEKTEEG